MKKRLLSPLRVLSLLFLPGTLLAQPYATESVLHHGQFFKVAIAAPGIYKLDAEFLSKAAGINLSQTAAQNITLWTNGGGPLPQLTTAPRVDDLREVAMLGVGTADGKVDPADYFLFYAEGPDQISLGQDNRFRTVKNIYDNYNYYFICVSDRVATAITDRASLTGPEASFNLFDDYIRLEEDKVNLLGRFRPPGSGQRWFGDEFSVVRQREYEINFPDIIPGSEVLISYEFAGRSNTPTTVTAEFNGHKFPATISAVNTGHVEADYARITQVNGSYLAVADKQTIRFNYPQSGSASSGWLDYIQAQAKRQLKFSGTPIAFRNPDTRQFSASEFVITGAPGTVRIWDITDPQRPVNQEFATGGNQVSFVFESEDSITREFIVFAPGTAYPVPIAIGAVANQNLHGIADADLVIVYHKDFTSSAQRLAQHRLEHNGYLVEAIPVDQIMNEFAGGGNDPTAIRDFARMLKSRSERFRFLLLFGDGTYDMRYINKEQNNDNFIPVYETQESMNPIRSFPTDDYFTLLSDGEGQDLRGAVDIAVGRFPVSTAAQAEAVVNKIIHYETSAKTLDDWRLRIAYVADDEDSNLHLLQTEDVANTQQLTHPQYNVQKIYLDAYQQISTPGGARYPDVNAAINAAIGNGLLILNYFGHGGPAGWAQERVLTVPDIQSWTNFDRLPLLITATCSFAAYDEPSLLSAGEHVFLNPAGGAVALLTTVRAVYSSSNKRLTSEVFERILIDHALSNLTIGEVLMLAKNSNHLDTVDINARKFALLGDPSMFLALPQNEIVITHVNHVPVDGTPRDTVGALQAVTMSGEIRDKHGNTLEHFNGLLNVTVFDKPIKQKTLGNDPLSSEREFETQNKVLFKGKASVTDGNFAFTFVVPQDINFAYGRGKVSMYASDLVAIDAAGYYRDLVIGGSGGGVVDTEGPNVKLYVDHEKFISGDETGPNPTIFIRLSDDSGINISGSSIGHNLQGTLNNDPQHIYLLNDRYVAIADDHTRGEVVLQLNGLEPGMHRFSVIAWDIANNFSEAEIDFRVTDDASRMIHNLRNMPNPFRDGTRFVFDHRLGDGPVNVGIEIFTTTGRLVHQISLENALSRNGVIEPIFWNGNGLSGGRLLPGVYFYRVMLTSKAGTSAEQRYESRYDKLIITD